MTNAFIKDEHKGMKDELDPTNDDDHNGWVGIYVRRMAIHSTWKYKTYWLDYEPIVDIDKLLQ